MFSLYNVLYPAHGTTPLARNRVRVPSRPKRGDRKRYLDDGGKTARPPIGSRPTVETADATETTRLSKQWWSQTGSNRRPHACKARALPAELWPRFGEQSVAIRNERNPFRPLTSDRLMVGLGRLELPTSRLSSARSNQLSYKPASVTSNQQPMIKSHIGLF
jgi:hypothetical protein